MKYSFKWALLYLECREVFFARSCFCILAMQEILKKIPNCTPIRTSILSHLFCKVQARLDILFQTKWLLQKSPLKFRWQAIDRFWIAWTCVFQFLFSF